MKVLIVGSGGREHALAEAMRRSPLLSELFVAPGNAGIARIADAVPISPGSVVEIADFAERAKVDLTVIGPELPLALGIVDEFEKRGLAVFGPTRRAAEIEVSKAFSKELCRRQGIPTAQGRVCSSREAAQAAVKEIGLPVAVKADGLAAGKGVLLVHTPEDAARALDLFFEQRAFGTAGERVIVEELLQGEEASFLAICDGTTALPLATAKDYKRVFDGDRGPNTGGMGAHSPAAVLDAETAAAVLRTIVHPALAGMAAEGREFRGVLYAGLMITAAGPKLLEFNARFGDPETEVILPRLESDLLPVLAAAARGSLSGIDLAWKNEACAAVVLASAGYPGAYETGEPISGLAEAAALPGVHLFHAATALRDGVLVTSGGRVLVVAGRGPRLADAVRAAYAAAERISFSGMTMRRDIGSRFVSG